jgi:hypothetical protein
MPVRIGLVYDADEPIPIGFLLSRHKIVFIRQRPPHVAIGAEPAYEVTKVTVIGIVWHAVESPVPFIVWMKQNNIGFDSQCAKLANAFFQMLEKPRVEPRKVPLVRRRACEGVQRRLVLVPGIPLRKNAHAKLVEGRLRERFQSLLLKLVLL